MVNQSIPYIFSATGVYVLFIESSFDVNVKFHYLLSIVK